MYRGPAYTGRSKATPSTTCQKCLKKDMRIPARFRRPDPTDTSLRHYSYECKASTQERPYVSRPSRTQQLFNPKLKPQLTSDVPNDLLRKKGVADETLAKKADERGRKHSRDDDDLQSRPRKRSRSVSSYSSSSVSTISTNRSPSRSPSHRQEAPKRSKHSPAGDDRKPNAQEFLASALLAVGHVAREGGPAPNTESITDVPTGLSGHHRATLAPRQQALGKEA
ncbi:hypothetical protein BFW01_g8229 [Lasiodiplodia theobromae]|nr:hypothetical protein BFW01_g8229 [Lasiodiplodia theobromae]